MTAFDDALAAAPGRPAPLVAAWDCKSKGHTVVNLYAVGAAGAKLVAGTEIVPDQREAMNDRLRAHGLRIGATYSYDPFVWVMDDRGLAIWSDTALVTDGAQLPAGEVRRVVTFFDAGDLGHRGVRVELAGGATIVLVDEHDPQPRLDPFYDQGSLETDLAWAFYLGQHLAAWLGVPHLDQLSGDVTNEAALTVRRLARALADELERAGVIATERRAAPCGNAGALALRLEPRPGGGTLSMAVTSPSGQTTTAHPIKDGATSDLVAFLRHVLTPHRLVRTLNDALTEQRRAGRP